MMVARMEKNEKQTKSEHQANIKRTSNEHQSLMIKREANEKKHFQP